MCLAIPQFELGANHHIDQFFLVQLCLCWINPYAKICFHCTSDSSVLKTGDAKHRKATSEQQRN